MGTVIQRSIEARLWILDSLPPTYPKNRRGEKKEEKKPTKTRPHTKNTQLLNLLGNSTSLIGRRTPHRRSLSIKANPAKGEMV